MASTSTQRIEMSFSLNGAPAQATVEPELALVDMLRDRLGLKGTKRSCDMQVCGACTVLIDGEPVSSCTVPAFEVRGHDVLTIEGVAADDEASVIGDALVENAGIQCGYCTPGMVLAAKSLLDRNANPTEAEVRDYMQGNICRCTGYKKILESIADAAQRRAK
jgi:carbon-monoxide dehydrogenase small subunit